VTEVRVQAFGRPQISQNFGAAATSNDIQNRPELRKVDE